MIYRDLSILSSVPLSRGPPTLGKCSCGAAAQTSRETQNQLDCLPALVAQSGGVAEASSGGEQARAEGEGVEASPAGQQEIGEKEGPEAAAGGRRGRDGLEGAEAAPGGQRGLGKAEGAGSCSGQGSTGMSSDDTHAYTKPRGEARRTLFAEIEDAGGSKSMGSGSEGGGFAQADEVQTPDPIDPVPGNRPPSGYLPVHPLALSFRNAAAEAKFGLEFARKRYWVSSPYRLPTCIPSLILVAHHESRDWCIFQP